MAARARTWTPDFDLSTVPDHILLAESARRLRARQTAPPRAKVLRQCPKCLQPFGARDLRRHIPQCGAHAGNGFNLRRVVSRVASQEEQDRENYRYWQSVPVGQRLEAVCDLTEAAYSLKRAE